MNTIALLDAVKARHGLKSDYAAAELLGMTRSQISRYRNGQDFFGDEVAIKVASLLGEDPGLILLHVHAERAKDDTSRAVWRGLTARLKGGAVAAGVAMFCGGWTGGPDGGAIAAPLPGDQGQSVYYVKRLLRLIRLRLAKLNPATLTGFGLASA